LVGGFLKNQKKRGGGGKNFPPEEFNK